LMPSSTPTFDPTISPTTAGPTLTPTSARLGQVHVGCIIGTFTWIMHVPLSVLPVAQVLGFLGSIARKNDAPVLTQQSTLNRLTAGPTKLPTRLVEATWAPVRVEVGPQQEPALLCICNGHGACNQNSQACSCVGGWALPDCSLFVFISDVLGNTSELGAAGSEAIVRISLRRAVSSSVVCLLRVSRPDEAALERSTISFMPGGDRSLVVPMVGIPDYVEDGPQRFTIDFSKCSSPDGQYVFTDIEIGQSWNEDVPFPEIVSVEPTSSSMIGQQVTILGSKMLNDTQVYVDGLLISGPPGLRCVLHVSGATYEVSCLACYRYSGLAHVILRAVYMQIIFMDENGFALLENLGFDSSDRDMSAWHPRRRAAVGSSSAVGASADVFAVAAGLALLEAGTGCNGWPYLIHHLTSTSDPLQVGTGCNGRTYPWLSVYMCGQVTSACSALAMSASRFKSSRAFLHKAVSYRCVGDARHTPAFLRVCACLWMRICLEFAGVASNPATERRCERYHRKCPAQQLFALHVR
jgi:hypothetical protein